MKDESLVRIGILIFLVMDIVIIMNLSHFTGMAVSDSLEYENIMIDKNFSDIVVYDIDLNNSLRLKSISLYGKVKSNDSVRIYLMANNTSYLVMDSSELASHVVSGITGFAVADNITDDSADLNSTGKTNETESDVAGIVNDTVIPDALLNDSYNGTCGLLLNESDLWFNDSESMLDDSLNGSLINESLNVSNESSMVPVLNETLNQSNASVIDIGNQTNISDADNISIGDVSAIINESFNESINDTVPLNMTNMTEIISDNLTNDSVIPAINESLFNQSFNGSINLSDNITNLTIDFELVDFINACIQTDDLDIVTDQLTLLIDAEGTDVYIEKASIAYYPLKESEINDTNVTNTTNASVQVLNEPMQGIIEIGKPVEWTIIANETVEIPADAMELNVSTEGGVAVDADIQVENITLDVATLNKVKELESYKKNKTQLEKSKSKGNNGSYGVSAAESLELDHKIAMLEREVPLKEIRANPKIIVNESKRVVRYMTEPPQLSESNATKVNKTYRKDVKVYSNVSMHYYNVLSYTDIPESDAGKVHLLWKMNESKVEVVNDTRFNVTFIDTNNNSLVDRISWIVPQLSEQEFEIVIDIEVLNVQSYPIVGRNWTVEFNTTGQADLVITTINGTTFTEIPDSSLSEDDLEFLEMKCGDDNVSDVYVVDENNVSMPYEAYNLKRKIEKINRLLEELE